MNISYKTACVMKPMKIVSQEYLIEVYLLHTFIQVLPIYLPVYEGNRLSPCPKQYVHTSTGIKWSQQDPTYTCVKSTSGVLQHYDEEHERTRRTNAGWNDATNGSHRRPL